MFSRLLPSLHLPEMFYCILKCFRWCEYSVLQTHTHTNTTHTIPALLSLMVLTTNMITRRNQYVSFLTYFIKVNLPYIFIVPCLIVCIFCLLS